MTLPSLAGEPALGVCVCVLLFVYVYMHVWIGCFYVCFVSAITYILNNNNNMTDVHYKKANYIAIIETFTRTDNVLLRSLCTLLC